MDRSWSNFQKIKSTENNETESMSDFEAPMNINSLPLLLKNDEEKKQLDDESSKTTANILKITNPIHSSM